MSRHHLLPFLAIATMALLAAARLPAAGARSFKTGPIQISADGAWIWVANADNDSVSRIETATDIVTEYPLPVDRPGPGAARRHSPRGLSVSENGSEVWVACHDSDRVYVLAGHDGIIPAGFILGRIDLPWGSGPVGVALSRPDVLSGQQQWALVTCHRAEAIDIYDAGSRALIRRLAPTFRSPLGAAWLDDGVTAWVTHLFADGEDPRMSRVDMSGPEPKLKSEIFAKSTDPKSSLSLNDPVNPARNIAEGGYLTFRGHPAQRPMPAGGGRVWCPTQYNNINEAAYSPDSTIQSTIRHLDSATHLIPNTNNDKVILTAVHVHDPTTGGSNSPYVGPGWDARVSGPVDIGFSADGVTGVVLFEQSDDLIVMPTSTPAVKTGASSLPEVNVGSRPLGMALSPVNDLAFVWNSLSFDVSVVNLTTLAELRRIPVTPSTTPRFPLDSPSLLRGARLFHTSADPRISINQKVACASCHPHGEHDGRTWDFQALPGLHGPRQTQSLLGISLGFGPQDPVTGFGQLHHSGDRDEIQDFDHTFTGVSMAATGFLGGAANIELGASNAGLDADLDAIAEYVLALPAIERSPHRQPDGSLSEAAVRGATFFAGINAASPNDSSCITCHVPETGFTDLAFHDVGQRRPAAENELNAPGRNPFQWFVNTLSLVGVWTTPPYDGVSTWAENMFDLVRDLATRSTHGRPGNLTSRQQRDLSEFILSIDGNTTAAEVRGARDTSPPRVVRVEPVSLTAVDMWFSEALDGATLSPGDFRVRDVRGAVDVAIPALSWSATDSDKVTLQVNALERGCAPITYEVSIVGAIADRAGMSSGGTANLVDMSDSGNTHGFMTADTLTVSLGASAYENLPVKVHDCAAIGPNWGGGSHGSIWLNLHGPPGRSVAWLRFDWAAAFSAATGVTSSADIVDASVTLHGEWGDTQVIEARRCLKPWNDGGHGDWSYQNPPGAPSWNNNINGSSPWGTAGCVRRTAGIEGTSPTDYNGLNDTAFTPDVSAAMAATNEPLVLGGPNVTDAVRFWFDNPSIDFGYALHLAAGSWHESKFHRSESGLGLQGPVLTITYRVPQTINAPPPEVSAPASAQQLLLSREPGGLRFMFEDLGLQAASYSVYQGRIRARSADPADWYSHAGVACNAAPALVASHRELVVPEPPGSAYFLVTASDPCDEGPTGTDSFGIPQDPNRRDCLP